MGRIRKYCRYMTVEQVKGIVETIIDDCFYGISRGVTKEDMCRFAELCIKSSSFRIAFGECEYDLFSCMWDAYDAASNAFADVRELDAIIKEGLYSKQMFQRIELEKLIKEAEAKRRVEQIKAEAAIEVKAIIDRYIYLWDIDNQQKYIDKAEELYTSMCERHIIDCIVDCKSFADAEDIIKSWLNISNRKMTAFRIENQEI